MLAAVAVVAALLSVPVSAQALSGVATLDGITVAGGDLSPGFSSDVRFYRVDVVHGEDRATVGFDKGHPAQAVAFEDGSGAGLADVDAGEAGHQVDLAYGANTVRLVVTPADAAADAAVYTLSIVRAEPAVDGVSADRVPATVVPAGLDDRPVAANEKRLVFDTQFDTRSVVVTEGSRVEYGVKLGAKPSGEVTVVVSASAGGDLVLGRAADSMSVSVSVSDSGSVLALTFGTTDWDTFQSVRVHADDDADFAIDFETLHHTASGGGYDGATGDVTVTVADDDTGALVLDRDDLVLGKSLMTIPESKHGRRDLGVKLGAKPTGNVTVSVSVPDGFGSDLVLTDGDNSMKVTGSHPVLEKTFTTSNWNTYYYVDVFGTHDADDVDDFHTLRFAVSGPGHDFYVDVPVRVADDESGVLVFDSRSVSVTEGSHSEYGVKLGAKPSGLVTVEVAVPGGDDSDLVLSTPSAMSVSVSDSGSVLALTFGTADWDTYQSVRVHADEDADTVDDSATLRHAVTGGGHDFYADVAVTVEDTDTDTLVFSDTAVTVFEGSSGSSYGVKLSAKPSGPVTFSVAVVDGARSDLVLVTPSESVSVSDSSPTPLLTFGTADWDTYKSVTVYALDDADVGDDSETLVNSATGGGYSAAANVEVTVVDDDNGRLVFDPPSVSVDEGMRGGYGVKLSALPSGPVTVAVSVSARSDLVLGRAAGSLSVSASVSGPVLELTFGTADWDTYQTVRVHADEDDDVGDDTATLHHTATGGGYVSITGDVAVTVTDDDTGMFEFTGTPVTVGEGKSSRYGVRLSAPPSGDVAFSVAVVDGARSDLVLMTPSESVSVSDSSPVLLHTFGTADWNTYKSVTVHALEDIDIGDDSETLVNSAVGGGYSVEENVSVTVDDDDTGRLVFDPPSVSVDEGARVGYAVRLSRPPSGTVSVVVSVSAAGDLVLGRAGDLVSVSASVSGPVLTLTFAPGDWNTYQTVRVHADEDADLVNDTATLHHEASGGGYVSVTGDVAVTVVDDDVAELVFDPPSVTVLEGTSVGYGVKLSALPSGTVSVVVSVSAAGDLVLGRAADSVSVSASVSGPVLTLTFGTGDWDTFQSVRVHADDDADLLDDTATLHHAADGGGYASVTGDVAVTVTDDDVAALVLNPSSVSVDEGMRVGYGVRLSRPPSGSVSVVVSVSAAGDLVLGRAGDSVSVSASVSGPVLTLTFGTADWDTVQSVRVHADEDPDLVDDTATLHHTASGGGYVSVTGDVAVTVTDDDVAALVLDPVSVSVVEGMRVGYGVRLSALPSGSVSVVVSVSAAGDLVLGRAGDLVSVSASVSGPVLTLTFGTADWDTVQSVEVHADEDPDPRRRHGDVASHSGRRRLRRCDW